MNQKANTKQIRTIYAIIRNKGMNKEEMVSSFTEERTTHLSEMTFDEANEMIVRLKESQYHEYKADKMRKKILYYCHMMRWYIPDTNKLDFNRINQFCVDKGHKHKPLNDYTVKELPMLVSQWESVYEYYLSKI